MSGFNDGLEAPELDQPVLELQAGQQVVSGPQQQGAGVGTVVGVAQGGTGSSTAAGALSNLGAAPSNATYITQTASAGLSAEQALAALATGYMKSAITTGVITTQAIPIPASDGGTGSTKVYVALLTQTGTNAPSDTVLINTLGGSVVWARSSAGTYTATLSGAFTSAKTVVFASGGSSSKTLLNGVRTSNNVVTLTSWDSLNAVVDDSLMTVSGILIFVYP